MKRSFRTQAEQSAYALGLADAAPTDEDAEPLTLDDVKKMSQAEVIQRKPEIDALLAGGNS